MSQQSEQLHQEKMIVLTSDICSSTSILEDLHRTENLKTWRDFLIWMKKFLTNESEKEGFVLYKFTGDGWILLLKEDHPGDNLFAFLERFSKAFQIRFRKRVAPLLETPANVIGLTFGVDKGTLVRIVMNNKREYVGRALNVACRLQEAIKARDIKPQFKVLLTRHLFNSIQGELSTYRCDQVKRTLRNIAGDKVVRCIKIWLKSRPRTVTTKSE